MFVCMDSLVKVVDLDDLKASVVNIGEKIQIISDNLDENQTCGDNLIIWTNQEEKTFKWEAKNGLWMPRNMIDPVYFDWTVSLKGQTGGTEERQIP